MPIHGEDTQAWHIQDVERLAGLRQSLHLQSQLPLSFHSSLNPQPLLRPSSKAEAMHCTFSNYSFLCVQRVCPPIDSSIDLFTQQISLSIDSARQYFKIYRKCSEQNRKCVCPHGVYILVEEEKIPIDNGANKKIMQKWRRKSYNQHHRKKQRIMHAVF